MVCQKCFFPLKSLEHVFIEVYHQYLKLRLGRPKRRWKRNIIIDLKEVVINTWKWVDSAQDSNYWRVLAKATLKFRVH